jgi:lysophospholipase L1-like esterase
MSPIDRLGPVVRRRGTLDRTVAALARGELTVGFLGGSITSPQGGARWPAPLAGWLADAFAGVRISVENAALGATGSDLAAFRAQPEIIARGCDLVFVEYGTNDFGEPTPRRTRTREGLLRQLLRDGKRDVVLVYTYCPEMHADIFAGTVPSTIAEFEALAERYGLSSVWMGLHALREVRRGLLTWEEWLPDGLHPENRGSLVYAHSVTAFLAEALAPAGGAGAPAAAGALPPPSVPGCWERVRILPFSEVEWSGPWTAQRWKDCLGLDRVLLSTAPGARLRVAFSGRGLFLTFDFGKTSGEIRYRVDGGEWRLSERDCPSWVGACGWPRSLLIDEALPPGPHQFELETLPGSVTAGRGTRTAIGLFGVIE